MAGAFVPRSSDSAKQPALRSGDVYREVAHVFSDEVCWHSVGMKSVRTSRITALRLTGNFSAFVRRFASLLYASTTGFGSGTVMFTCVMRVRLTKYLLSRQEKIEGKIILLIIPSVATHPTKPGTTQVTVNMPIDLAEKLNTRAKEAGFDSRHAYLQAILTAYAKQVLHAKNIPGSVAFSFGPANPPAEPAQDKLQPLGEVPIVGAGKKALGALTGSEKKSSPGKAGQKSG